MSFYYLSSYHSSYSTRTAQLVQLSLCPQIKPDNLVSGLVLQRECQLEVWLQEGEQYTKSAKGPFLTNFRALHFFKVRNYHCKEDGMLFVSQEGLIFMLAIVQGKLRTVSRTKLDYKQPEELNYFFSENLDQKMDRFLCVFDKAAEITLFKIGHDNDFLPSIENKFRIFNMVSGPLLFPISQRVSAGPQFESGSFSTDSETLSLGLVTGNQLQHFYLSFMEINSNTGKINSIEQKKEIHLSSSHKGDEIQEQVIGVFEIQKNQFAVFMSFTLKQVLFLNLLVCRT